MKENSLMEIAKKEIENNNAKPVYICISGAHLYGFPSIDSDIDLRCCHVNATSDYFHLQKPRDTIEKTINVNGEIIDLVSHEIEKVLKLLLQNNSNVLEHIFAKNLFITSEYKELKRIADKALSKVVFNPYRGMAEFNYRKFIDSDNPVYNKSVKKYLYIIRAYMAGIYALENRKIQPNIQELNKKFKSPIVDELTKLKKKGEKEIVTKDTKKIEDYILDLKSKLIIAKESSKLPDNPINEEEIDNFLYRIRIKNMR